MPKLLDYRLVYVFTTARCTHLAITIMCIQCLILLQWHCGEPDFWVIFLALDCTCAENLLTEYNVNRKNKIRCIMRICRHISMLLVSPKNIIGAILLLPHVCNKIKGVDISYFGNSSLRLVVKKCPKCSTVSLSEIITQMQKNFTNREFVAYIL